MKGGDKAKLLTLALMLVWGIGKRSPARAARPQNGSRRGTPPPTPQPPPAGPVWPVPAGKMPTAARLRFGFQRTPTHKHQGVDIVAPEGSSVLAPLPGKVVHVNHKHEPGFSGYGKAAVLKVAGPGGVPLYVLFAHLADVEVREGDDVAAGARIGHVGRTKFTKDDPTAMFASSGAHVHLEISRAPYPQDSEAPTRLDPAAVWARLTA